MSDETPFVSIAANERWREGERRIAELETEVARLEAYNDEIRGERDRASGMLRDSEMQLRRVQGARDAARKISRESAAAKAQARANDAEEEIGELRARISWARGMCTDEAPHKRIDHFLGCVLAGHAQLPAAFDEQEAAG